jgi:hypothetical protein
MRVQPLREQAQRTHDTPLIIRLSSGFLLRSFFHGHSGYYECACFLS